MSSGKIRWTCIVKSADGKSCPNEVIKDTPHCEDHRGTELPGHVDAALDEAEAKATTSAAYTVALIKGLATKIAELEWRIEAYKFEVAPCVICKANLPKETDHDYCQNCAHGDASLVAVISKEYLEKLRVTFKEPDCFESDVKNMIEAAIDIAYQKELADPRPPRDIEADLNQFAAAYHASQEEE